jgi:hypothetical protein
LPERGADPIRLPIRTLGEVIAEDLVPDGDLPADPVDHVLEDLLGAGGTTETDAPTEDTIGVQADLLDDADLVG